MTKILAIQGSNLKKLNIKTDTTILLATEAQKRGYKIFYFEPENISFLNVGSQIQEIRNALNSLLTFNTFFGRRSSPGVT